jgi:hypothetical protein
LADAFGFFVPGTKAVVSNATNRIELVSAQKCMKSLCLGAL